MNNKVARVLAGVLTGLVLLGGSVANAASVAAEPSENTVLVNGQEVHFDSYLIDGRNYVQLRELGDATGFTVDWDEKTNSVLITTAISGREEAVAVIDGQTLRVGAILVDGKRYIALEDLAKLDGADFNATTGRLNFTAPGQIEMAARLARQRNLLWVLGALLAVAVLVLIPLLRRRAQGVTELAETRVTTEVPKSPLLRLHHETEHEEVRQEEVEEKQSVVQERATRQIVDEICGSVCRKESGITPRPRPLRSPARCRPESARAARFTTTSSSTRNISASLWVRCPAAASPTPSLWSWRRPRSAAGCAWVAR